jgi:hypothetical protein
MLQKISQWLQYIYFLRFCIFSWLFVPVLLLLDAGGKTTSITRGIFTLENGWQAYNAAFFILALNMTVLITARNIVRNGPDRFSSDLPDRLKRSLCSTTTPAMWTTLVVVHLPTIITVCRLYVLAIPEKIPYLLLLLLGGLVAGMAFWYLVSLFYYWTYRSTEARLDPSALIFPERPGGLFTRVSRLHPPSIANGLESLLYPLLKLTHMGYAGSDSGPIWELHFLSGVSFWSFFLFYVFLYPATAPIPRHTSFYILAVAATVLLIAFVWAILATPSTGDRSLAIKMKATFVVTAVGLYLVFFSTNLKDWQVANRLEFAFPALASILVIANFGLWFLAGLSFLLDRYRVSVVVISCLLIFGPKQCDSRSGEHYYAVKALDAPVSAPSPADVLTSRLTDPDKPYIIVTASGGGIHAAAWTAQVMHLLETKFAEDPDLATAKYTFHDHLLLASGVSGGSDGLMPYLLEYTVSPGGFSDAGSMTRITAPPACSGLEAVAWGLEYYDLYRLLFTTEFPFSLLGDERPDRSWALAEAFNRNLHDVNCKDDATGAQPNANHFSLNDAAILLRQGKMPAFTFNTTSEETGNRFLLSDYTVPPPQPNPDKLETDFVPSQSFLEVYAQKSDCGKTADGKPCNADLPLATAARLSATFPYVSSGTRIPPRYSAQAYHFLDGGYFDNDGTASVIEFLKSALDGNQARCPAGSAKHCRILLLEIRDGGDLSQESEDDELNQLKAKDWKIGAQITAPPKGLWNSGHVSIARRNRRELCLLQRAYPQIEIHHIVFPIYTLADKYQPLSWKLTQQQETDINDWAIKGYDGTPVKEPVPKVKIGASIAWVKSILNPDPNAKPVTDQTGCYVYP